MILDSSALIAIFMREPGHGALVEKLSRVGDAGVGVGAPTLAETCLVLARRLRTDPRPLMHRFLDEARVVEIPFGDQHWHVTVDAYLRFGKGKHKAALNFGDCMTYAMAKLADRPLLCVGNDFTHTDLRLA